METCGGVFQNRDEGSGADPLPAVWGEEIADSQGLSADKAMTRA